MLDTTFKPLSLSEQNIFKKSAETLVNERERCHNFLNRTLNKEIQSANKLIKQYEQSIQREKDSLKLLSIYEEACCENISLIQNNIDAVITAEVQRENEKKNRKKTLTLAEKEEELLAQLAEVRGAMNDIG